MTTYSICKPSGEHVGTFEAANPREAAQQSGYIGDVIVTAVGLPAPAACPFKLPLSVGNSAGQSPDQIYDSTDQAVLILYSVDSRGTVDEARTMSWNQHGLVRGDYVVKAVNEHEGLVKRVERQHKNLALMAKYNREFVQENRKLVKRVAEMQLSLDAVRAALDDAFDKEVGHARSVLRLKRAFDAEAKLGETYKKLAMAGELPEIVQLTAKPVDRRKD